MDLPELITPYTEGNLIAPGVHLPDPSLWADMIEGFQLDRHTDQKRVQQELRWLKRHPSYLHRMHGLLSRHLAYIHAEVAARGMPSELALLPIVVARPGSGSSSPPRPNASAWNGTGGTKAEEIRWQPRTPPSTTWNTCTDYSTTGIWRWPAITPARAT
jgi:hypothetical protein